MHLHSSRFVQVIARKTKKFENYRRFPIFGASRSEIISLNRLIAVLNLRSLLCAATFTISHQQQHIWNHSFSALLWMKHTRLTSSYSLGMCNLLFVLVCFFMSILQNDYQNENSIVILIRYFNEYFEMFIDIEKVIIMLMNILIEIALCKLIYNLNC